MLLSASVVVAVIAVELRCDGRGVLLSIVCDRGDVVWMHGVCVLLRTAHKQLNDGWATH